MRKKKRSPARRLAPQTSPYLWKGVLSLGLLSLLLLAAADQAAAQPAGRTVSRLQAKYERIRSFSADFRQIFRGRNVELEESGVVIMKKPGKMYWEYRNPAPKLFVADGRRSYFYVPADQQVLVTDLDLSEASTPLLFLLGKGSIERDFRIMEEPEEKGLVPDHVLVRLIPRRPGGEFEYLVLEVDPATSLIHRLIVIEPLGNRNEYVLSNLRENVSVPDGRFRFEVPEGTQVIEP